MFILSARHHRSSSDLSNSLTTLPKTCLVCYLGPKGIKMSSQLLSSNVDPTSPASDETSFAYLGSPGSAILSICNNAVLQNSAWQVSLEVSCPAQPSRNSIRWLILPPYPPFWVPLSLFSVSSARVELRR